MDAFKAPNPHPLNDQKLFLMILPKGSTLFQKFYLQDKLFSYQQFFSVG